MHTVHAVSATGVEGIRSVKGSILSKGFHNNYRIQENGGRLDFVWNVNWDNCSVSGLEGSYTHLYVGASVPYAMAAMKQSKTHTPSNASVVAYLRCVQETTCTACGLGSVVFFRTAPLRDDDKPVRLDKHRALPAHPWLS